MAETEQWKPNVTVSAIAHREGRFLVVEEDAKGEIVFNQPSGHLEDGETLLDAVRREVLEETGWTFEPESLVGVYLFQKPGPERLTYLRFCFAGRCVQHDPGRALDDGILRVEWLSRAELAGMQHRMRSPMVLRCIDDFLAGRTYPLDMVHHVGVS